MARHVITVCIFCLICATHTPCDSHASVEHEDSHTLYHTDIKSVSREKFKMKKLLENSVFGNSVDAPEHSVNKRDSNSINSIDSKNICLKKLFTKFGDGKTITLDGFRNLFDHVVALQETHKDTSNDTCNINQALASLAVNSTDLNYTTVDLACSAILYSVVSGKCDSHNINETGTTNGDNKVNFATWLYSICAVFVISACGVLSLAIIPVMQKKFYKPLIQFLVALAVGTLAGDALLHLLPHAMSSGHSHEHNHEDHENMWKGFVAMLGLVLFFVMERFIPLLHRCRKGNPIKGRVKVLNSGLDINKTADTKCIDRYNAYPRCYKDIVDDPNTTFLEAGEASNVFEELLNSRKKKPSSSPDLNNTKDKSETNQNQTECPNDLNAVNNCTEVNKMLTHIDINHSEQPEGDYNVILTEHGVAHHGHSHLHGHVHAAPQNFSSVAWMVIMGDGLHNFTDGMAIGAAFSGSIAGGFSTAVAVFCHELPHEVGDFAMLLKAGMSFKQAFFYNIISSILCFLGNALGIWLGNTDSASSWVFAVAAGTFIYIALVDMLPELSSAHEDEGNLVQCVLHLGGLLLGFGIMTLIALYEHDLKHIFRE